jgi:hypothetical protein
MTMQPQKIAVQIFNRQRDYLKNKAKEKIGENASPTEVANFINEVMKRYYQNLGNPLFLARRAIPEGIPFYDDYEENKKEVAEDLSILFAELNTIAKYLMDYFNYGQSEQKRLLSMMKGMHSLINDLQMLTQEENKNYVYWKESFQNYEQMDTVFTPVEMQAHLHTEQGVLTLQHTSSVNYSPSASIRTLEGNGEAGTYHLVRKVNQNENDENYLYISTQTPNDAKESLIDGSSDSVFEYQLCNVPESVKQDALYYDFEWAKGEQNEDLLRLRIVIELPTAKDINWININPFYSPNSPSTVNVYSIRTSKDGFSYDSLYGELVLNNRLNVTPQTYRLEEVFGSSDKFEDAKFTGQGVWTFPTRTAKYIEIVLDQPTSYKELLGQTAYYRRLFTSDQWVRIPRQDVPANIVDEKFGTYQVDSFTEIKKTLEPIEGWRYSIGVKDIGIMGFEYKQSSEYVSKPFRVEEGIQSLALYANEKIPASYLDKISTSNDWIQYFVTFDNINWHRISPNHHQPVSDSFPPKLISINHDIAQIDETILYKENVTMKTLPQEVRVKILLTHPEATNENEFNMTTPVVEDIALKILPGEGKAV